MNTDKNPAPQSDRWSYLWLAVGVALFALSMGRFRVALAAWLAPGFLIRFVRSRRIGRGLWMILLGLCVSYAIGWYAILVPQLGLPFFLFFTPVIAVQNSLPFLADRLLAPRIKGFVATLVYPLSVTASFL